jgi:hypothetical protein
LNSYFSLKEQNEKLKNGEEGARRSLGWPHSETRGTSSGGYIFFLRLVVRVLLVASPTTLGLCETVLSGLRPSGSMVADQAISLSFRVSCPSPRPSGCSSLLPSAKVDRLSGSPATSRPVIRCQPFRTDLCKVCWSTFGGGFLAASSWPAVAFPSPVSSGSLWLVVIFHTFDGYHKPH